MTHESPAAPAPIHVDHENQRFVMSLPEGEGELNYMPIDGVDDVREYTRTFIPPEARERGHGERLVLFALDHARTAGYGVIPTCPFVRAVIEEHPEYEALVRRR